MIPTTILGGFLGAGKTTALNHLLRHAQARVGVLVNDFGAINVDAGLIEAQEGDLVALSNGCVCCSIGPDLGDSLARLLARQPARIVVEASGVSDPWRVAQLAKLEPGVLLEAVPVLVDATAFLEHLADPWLADTLERQLARADLVAITKCDLASPARRAATSAAVQRLRPDARVFEMAGGALPDFVLGGDLPAPPASRFLADPPWAAFQSWSWRPPASLDRARLGAVLDGLPSAVLRAKGVCRLGPAQAPHVLQLAGRRWSLTPAASATPPAIVLIGTAALPPPGALETLFAGTILTPAVTPGCDTAPLPAPPCPRPAPG